MIFKFVRPINYAYRVKRDLFNKGLNPRVSKPEIRSWHNTYGTYVSINKITVAI
jgi:hypothetical protein